MASSNEKKIMIKMGADTSQVKATIQSLASDIKKQIASVNSASKAFATDFKSKMGDVNTAIGKTNQLMSQVAASTAGMNKAIREGFQNMSNLLSQNNAEIMKMVQNLSALHQQQRAIDAANKAAKANDPHDPSKLSASFVQLKAMNFVWNSIQSTIMKAKDDVLELNNTVAHIVSISGEKFGNVQSQIFELSNKSGFAVNEIAKALQDSTNEGNNLTKSFEKINAGIILSTKSMGSLENSIARIDDIVDQFGVTADQALGIVMGKNISSERALKVFSKMGKDAQEAGMDIQQLSSLISVMANDLGVSEMALQIGMRGVVNGIQNLGESSRKYFYEDILPNWKNLDDATKRQVENMIHVKDHDKFLDNWGNNLEKMNALTKDNTEHMQEYIDKAKKLPETELKSMNELYNVLLGSMGGILAIITPIGTAMAKFLLHNLENVGNLVIAFTELNYILGRNQATMAKLGTTFEDMDRNRNLEKLNNIREQLAEQTITLPLQYKLDLMKQEQELLRSLGIHRNQIAERDAVRERAAVAALGNRIELTKKLDEHKIATATPEGAARFQSGMAQKENLEITNLEKRERLENGKRASLEKQIGLYDQLITKFQKEIDFQKEFQKGDARYYKEAEEQLTRASNKKLEAEIRLKELKEKNSKDAAKAADKAAEDDKKRALDIYNEHHTRILQRRAEGKISAQQEVTELKMIQGILFGVEKSHNKIAEAEKEQALINKQNNDEYVKMHQNLTKITEVNTEKMAKEQLAYERALLMRERKGRDLTPQQEIAFLERDYALAYARHKQAGERSRDDIIAQYNTAMSKYTQMTEAQYKAMTDEKQAAVNFEISEINRSKDAQLAAFDAQFSAESVLMAKRQALYEQSHLTIKDIQQTIASHMERTMGTVVDKLIFNTGKLSHIWKDLMKNIAADLAKKAISKFVFGAAGGLIGSLFDIGHADGTGMKGVRGYASGSPMKGVDSVPAMLSPGEIVLDNNASDMFRSVIGGANGGQNITIVVQSNPSLLGNREELYRLDQALNNPLVRTSLDRRKV